MSRVTRRRRWILRIVLGLVALIVVSVGATLLILANLGAGPVKRFVQGRARAQGIEIEYEDGGVTLGGLHMAGLQVLSPEADRSLAPALVSIGRIDGSWSPFSKRVDELVIRDVAMTIVVDPDGTTSLDRWLAGMPKTEKPPPEPLSQVLSALLPRDVAANARVEGVSLTLLRRDGGDTVRLTGLQASAVLKDGGLTATVGPGELRLALGKREAVARLDVRVAVQPEGRVRGEVALALVRQNLAPELPVFRNLLTLALDVEPVPASKRTHVRVEKMALLDGAASLDAAADLPDAGFPVIHQVSSRVDLVALARAVPAEFGPVVVEAEPLRVAASKLEIVPTPRGTLEVKGEIARLSWRDIDVRGLGIDIDAHPEGGSVRAAVRLAVAQATAPGLAASGVAVDLAGESGDKVSVRGTIGVERVAGPAAVEGLHLDVDARDVIIPRPPAGPFDATGTIKLGGRIDGVDQRGTLRARQVAFRVDAGLGKPARAALELTAGRLFVPALGREFAGKPAAIAVDASRIEIDAANPARTNAEAKLEARLGRASIAGKVGREASGLTWALTGGAPRIGPARKLALRSRGSLGEGNVIEQDTSIRVGRLATPTASLRAADLHLTSSGTLRRQKARLVAAVGSAIVRRTKLGRSKLELTTEVDLPRRHLDLHLQGTVPAADLHLRADIDRRRAIHWQARGTIGRLGALAALLPPGLDWNRVAVELRGRGAVSGVVAGYRDGVPVLARNPAATARGKQSQKITIREIHFRGADQTRADIGALEIGADVTLGNPHVAHVEIGAPTASALASGVRLELDRLSARLDASLARTGATKADVVLKINELRQSALPGYPVREAEVSLTANGDVDTALALRARLANPGGGTTFQVSGQFERSGNASVPGRSSLTLDGRLEQVLEKLGSVLGTARARGRVAVPFRIESGDLALYRTSARVSLTDVSVELPAQKIKVTGVRGELPVLEEILVGPEGTELVGRGERGLYPKLRFADHRPFLGNADYVTAAGLTVAGRPLGPVAGNIRIDRDVVAIDQLELGVLGGKVTGQCLVEIRGKDTQVAFRGKVTGLRPSSGDQRLDASAALTLIPYRLGLEGRVEIVRIDKSHLLELLDLYDPYHAAVSANRVRLGLKFGYPKQVRLHFQRGFASLAVELGGLAGAVRIDEMKGIPIGPALSRWLAPVLEARR